MGEHGGAEGTRRGRGSGRLVKRGRGVISSVKISPIDLNSRCVRTG